jgi:hypothetical protein
MMRASRVLRLWPAIIIGSSLAAAPVGARASDGAQAPDGAATRAVFLDPTGTIRWSDSKQELGLYGANYCIMSGSDYRMAGLVSADRKAMIDEDLAQFARMGWTALRLCSWGDWENADAEGNLIVNEHVDLMDYVIAKARARGIYILLTPIHTYDPAFADQMNKPSPNVGFSRYFPREEMGTNPQSIAAQVNYIKQLLNHVNRYTGAAIKDEPAILFVEMINEPVHHPENLTGSIAYINALVDAVRSTGCKKLTFFNVSQDFAIAPAIQNSKVDGVSFGWYPSSLVAGHTLQGNFLQAVDDYPDMRLPALKGRPRIVYEFDQADLLTGYLYPAMARTYRSVGAQFATMFAYDMLQTAPFNLGWQTHYLNLVHTPKKAVSAVIAAEAMRRLPRFASYGRYPETLKFGDFRVSYEGDMSELNADDAFMNAGATDSRPRNPRALTRIVGFESSSVVNYEGTGAYFLDKVREGVWRLEVYPDEVLVEDPFDQPRPDKIVSRLLHRSWPMVLKLPDLGSQFFVAPITVPSEPAAAGRMAANAQFSVEPGVWLLTRSRQEDRGTLPSSIGRVGFDEYHVNARISYPDRILSMSPAEFLAGHPITIRARIANDALPEEVKLWVRPVGTRTFREAIPMQRSRGNDYAADLAAERFAPGLYEYAVSAKTGAHSATFPGGMPRQPGDWPFSIDKPWTFRVTPRGTPLRILNPKQDYGQLSFVRPGERFRQPFFELAPGEGSDESAVSLSLPDLGPETPERYAASLYVGDVVAARKKDVSLASAVDIKLRAVAGSQKSIDVLLIERDGTAWSTPATAGQAWSTIRVPLESLRISRSIHIPSPFPGLWNYWRQASALRGGSGDRIHIEDVERLELIVYPNSGTHSSDDAKGAAVESIRLEFPDAVGAQR